MPRRRARARFSNTNSSHEDVRLQELHAASVDPARPRVTGLTEAIGPPRTVIDLKGPETDDAPYDDAQSIPTPTALARPNVAPPPREANVTIQGKAAKANDASGSRISSPTVPLAPVAAPPGSTVRTAAVPVPVQKIGSAPVAQATTAAPPASDALVSAPARSAAVPVQTHFGYASAPAPVAAKAAESVAPTPVPPTTPTAPPITSDSNAGYPRYQRGDSVVAGLDLTPNRRPLYIGLGVVALAIVVAIAVFSGGGGKLPAVAADDADVAAPAAEPVTATKSNTPPPMPTFATKGSGAVAPGATKPGAKGSDEMTDDQIVVHVETPPVVGAEVDLDGKLLGKTPLDIKLKRVSASGQLVIKMLGYVDATAKVDLQRRLQQDHRVEEGRAGRAAAHPAHARRRAQGSRAAAGAQGPGHAGRAQGSDDQGFVPAGAQGSEEGRVPEAGAEHESV